MMRSKYLLFMGALALPVLAVVWMNQGCTASLPPLPAIAPTATPTLADDIISDFENRRADLNPTLRGDLDPIWNASTPVPTPGGSGTGRGGGAWSVNTFGGIPENTVNGLAPGDCNDPANPCFILPIPNTPPSLAANTSRYAAHIVGPLYITGGNYESHQLVCQLRRSVQDPYYDATSFTGIQFDIYIDPADTNTAPFVQIGIDLTTPPAAMAGGTCLGTQCYNHYNYSLAGVPKGVWTPVPIPWSFFNQTFGTIWGPLSGHLDKLLLIQYQFNNNSAASSTNNTDFWVDNVQFTP